MMSEPQFAAYLTACALGRMTLNGQAEIRRVEGMLADARRSNAEPAVIANLSRRLATLVGIA